MLLLPSLNAMPLLALDMLVRLMLLLLPPPQIGLTKDALFVDLFLWHHKKVNQEKMRTNKCPVYAMQFQKESMSKD